MKKNKIRIVSIWISSILLLQLFILTPVRFYLAEPNSYIINQQSFLYLVLFGLVTLITLLLLFNLAGLLNKMFSNIIMVFLLLLVLSYSLFDANFGVLDGIRFRDWDLVYSFNILQEIIVLGLVFLMTLIIVNKNIVGYFCLVSIGLLLSNFSVQLVDLKTKHSGVFSKQVAPRSTDRREIQGISLSQSGTNVIIVMADMFTGEGFQDVFESDKLSKGFSGFTWYPDTLSVSRSTVGGELAVLGGVSRSPAYINLAEQSEMTINQLWKSAFDPLIEVLVENKKSYEMSIYAPETAYTGSCKHIRESTQKKFGFSPTCVEKQEIAEGVELQTPSFTGYKLLGGTPLFGLFYGLPRSLKGLLYNSALWSKILRSESFRIEDLNKNLTDLYVLRRVLSNVDYSDADINIVYLKTKLAHNPFLLDKNCAEPGVRNLFKNDLKTGAVLRRFNHFENQRCFLKIISNFNSLLKERNVFDNSLIVLVSDHDNDDSLSLSNAVGKELVNGMGAHALLAVKYINTNRQLNISPALKSNSDVIEIVRKSLSHGSPKMIQSDKKLADFRFATRHPSHITYQDKYRFKISRAFKVVGSMFKKKNWIEIDL
jgi:hypothetical protein